ncbi:hypothetical protein Bca52824_056744 [Brassica carinata]|uniref:Uncharacterized protein n=1 Tax=Brassica carinata TaxID=52824 RepID=A0A8X7QPB6_BRACI|nr:hypothetical protein Bca52824_056744 [Brassica carinata]
MEISARRVLVELAFGDFVEKLAASNELHDEEDLGLGGHDFFQLDDVGVTNEFHDRDLAFDLFHHALSFQYMILVDDFDGDALAAGDLFAVVDLREGSFA